MMLAPVTESLAVELILGNYSFIDLGSRNYTKELVMVSLLNLFQF